MDSNNHVILDIGGTWIKGILIDASAFQEARLDLPRRSLPELTKNVHRIQSPVHSNPGNEEGILKSLLSMVDGFDCKGRLQSVVISTAGIVHSSGSHVLKCATHLAFLRSPNWREKLGDALNCEVTLMNDAEAFVLGAAELGYVPRTGTVCALVVGTGLGCAMVKEGRWFRPNRGLPLLGSIRLPKSAQGSYDRLVSASRLAAHDGESNLVRCFQNPALKKVCSQFWEDLATVIVTTAILHRVDTVLIGGGFSEAAVEAGVDICEEIKSHWVELPPELDQWPELEVVQGGNTPQLIGAAALAVGNEKAVALKRDKERPEFQSLPTEQIFEGSADLHKKSSREIVELLWIAEEAAGKALQDSLKTVAEVAEHVLEQWPHGGRIIYVGAGTSGRLAALDAVEIPCTYGTSLDRVVAVVAGGIAEAGLTIESDGEEDNSSVSDMILLNPGPHDTVIGISASGTARFVNSALTFARQRGAATAMIQSIGLGLKTGWDWTIPLNSGAEVVAGSTRMKAGTATKKIINFLTTTLMIRSGKVQGPYMIDMACSNVKLVARGKRILQNLFALSDTDAESLLEEHHFQLRDAIKAADHRQKD